MNQKVCISRGGDASTDWLQKSKFLSRTFSNIKLFSNIFRSVEYNSNLYWTNGEEIKYSNLNN